MAHPAPDSWIISMIRNLAFSLVPIFCPKMRMLFKNVLQLEFYADNTLLSVIVIPHNLSLQNGFVKLRARKIRDDGVAGEGTETRTSSPFP